MVNSGAHFNFQILQSLLLITAAIANLITLKRSPLTLLDLSNLVPTSNVLSLIWAHLGFEPGNEQNIDEAVCQVFSINYLSCEGNIFPNSNLGSYLRSSVMVVILPVNTLNLRPSATIGSQGFSLSRASTSGRGKTWPLPAAVIGQGNGAISSEASWWLFLTLKLPPALWFHQLAWLQG